MSRSAPAAPGCGVATGRRSRRTATSSRSADTPPAGERRAGAGTAVLAAAAWVAAVVAANGFVSLLTGAEVLPIAAAGPLALPVGVALAAAVIAARSARATAGSMLLPLELLLVGYLVPVLGAAAVALLSGIGPAVLTTGRLLLSWFTVADGVLAAVTGLVVLLLVRASAAGAGRPRWPWEGRDDP